MRQVSEYDKDGFLHYCTVVVDCDHMRVGVFVSGEDLLKATIDLSLAGILYHVTVFRFLPNERPHRKAVQEGYLRHIQTSWLLDESRQAYYTWLRDQKTERRELDAYVSDFRQKMARIVEKYTSDKRERYDND